MSKNARSNLKTKADLQQAEREIQELFKNIFRDLLKKSQKKLGKKKHA